MALLVTGEFYTATFYATTNAVWAALAPNMPSGINGVLAEAIYQAVPTAVTFYVVDAASGTIAYLGGQAYGFDDTLINPPGSATNLTKHVLSADDLTTTTWADDGAGGLLRYDENAGILRISTGAAVGGFQVFIAAI